ncbi:alpha/beta hydrolase fold domain-containing protein [Streptomyces sp. Li-HN-5-11]|uniref:alpha/beta hydrolase fold domain-containing protein n=1 Tax=Streptomyces sp. Li-HN-5-11 TaxID=3075432 RepID=UPI0028B0F16C|nr:alpha/beta hydrolase fold domain-containing protein [Streptomyces sp. Li-HN-5-11]WNM32007.1 alpha/beta hydrolase fold domain-containing protein [Streptomyces sp. Li-HN-5-11]WOP39220.1 alpha/beta hydrolase fold domain-containing protein [Streptomyces sp. Li-HN-5-13]
MSLLARPAVASLAARSLQRLTELAGRRSAGRGSTAVLHARFPEYPRDVRQLTVPTSVAPARVTVYRPPTGQAPAGQAAPAVHVNFHGGGYVMAQTELDDALCRFVAVEAGVAVVNVDYAVAPQHPFPAPPRQAFEVVRWVAGHGAAGGWDGARLTVGGQSAGGGLAAAVARQALEQGGPRIALQVLHYPPLDLATGARDKRAAVARPVLRPWMADLFDTAYVPDPRLRADPLVSPAHPSDTADLTGIAPALVITAEHDLLRSEGERYAARLRAAGALTGHVDVPGVDHGYDVQDDEQARQSYMLIARHVRDATGQ